MHTRIVCTLGPASNTPERIEELIAAGMNCARLNLSHSTHRHHATMIHTVRKIAAKMEKTVGILADLQGPKIRLGIFENGVANLTTGQSFILTAKKRKGDETGVSVTYKPIADDVKPGNRIFLADGLLEVIVQEVKNGEVITQVIKGGVIRDNQGLNLPGAALSTECLTKKDKGDVAFACKEKVDFIALSFVRSHRDVLSLRELVKQHGSDPFLIAKLEKPEALDNLDEILDASDGVMVARGDLGVEVPLWDVPRLQRRIIREAGRRAKFVITATQMLESMIDHPRPTRAEVTDIAAAVLDGTDALMLSGETAMGMYPTQAVQMMREVAASTEERSDYHPFVDDYVGVGEFMKAAASAAAEGARSLNVKAVISLTENGMMPRLLSHQHFKMPVLAASHDEVLLRKLSLIWGVKPLAIPKATGHEAKMREAIKAAKAKGLIQKGDSIILTFGMAPRQFNAGNVIRLHRVE